MDSIITHMLDRVRQARDSVRGLWVHGFSNHSHARQGTTSTRRRERAMDVWIQLSLTSYMGSDKHDTS